VDGGFVKCATPKIMPHQAPLVTTNNVNFSDAFLLRNNLKKIVENKPYQKYLTSVTLKVVERQPHLY
jgi:hypothetical protein